MAGLLDYGADPLGQGLLQMGAALMTPRALGGGLANGMLAFNAGAMQAQQYRRALEQDARRNKWMDAQIAEMDAQTTERKRKAASAEAQQQGLQSVLGDIAARSQPQFNFKAASAAANTGAPYAPQAPQGPVITQADVAKWVALGGDPKQLEAIVSAKDWGRPEVASWQEKAGPNGPIRVGVSKYGDQIGAGLEQPVKLEQVQTGSTIDFVNPYQTRGPITKTLTPGEMQAARDAAAGRAVSMRGQDLTDARARELAVLQREQGAAGRAPAGYRFKADGSLEFIPGGPADPATARDRPPTEAQGKAALFGARAEEANKVITSLEGKYMPGVLGAKSAVENVPVVGGVWGAAANWAMPAEYQKVEQAQRDFVNAVLRQESGAVISEPEFQNARKQYFPMPGDSKAVIEQKRKNRETAIAGLKFISGSPSRPQPYNGGATGSWASADDPLNLRGGKADPLGIR